MSKKESGGAMKKLRRRNVIERLQTQLKLGTKPIKDLKYKVTPLLEKDIKKIGRELETLKKRV